MGRLLNSEQIRNVVERVLAERDQRRFVVPSEIADEDQVLRHAHLDLARMTEPELVADLVDAAAALRFLHKADTSARVWWTERFAAVRAVLQRRRVYR